MIVVTKKRKMEGEKSSSMVENSEIESEQLEKTETSSPKECVIGIIARGGCCNNNDNGGGGSETVG